MSLKVSKNFFIAQVLPLSAVIFMFPCVCKVKLKCTKCFEPKWLDMFGLGGLI